MSRFFRNFIFHSLVERGTHQNNRREGRRPGPRYFSLVGLCFMMAAFPGSAAWGFSLGSMQVKSHFGERFNARILVSGQAVENLRVTIGSPQDYRKLGLERPQILDQLYIKMSPDIEGSGSSILLLSDKPLFYPSFNLVVKAQSDGRTLYENYLISVDFRKSVLLELNADRPENKKEKMEEERKSLPEKKAVVLAEKPEGIPDSSPPPGRNLRKAVHPTPLIVKEITPLDYVAALPKPRPAIKEPALRVNRAGSIPPKPRNEADKMASAIGLLSQIPNEPPAIKTKKPDTRNIQEPVLPRPTLIRMDRDVSGDTAASLPARSRAYGPVKSGETLMKVVSRLAYPPAERKKVAVALWMDNRDKFVKNNIHGLKQGETLDLSHLDFRLKELDRWQARWLLKNHWQEWRLIHSGKVTGPSVSPALQQLLLPAENRDVKQSILQVVEGWKTSWEDGNLERHLSFFLKDRPLGRDPNIGDFRYWRRFKGMMFARHKNVRLHISKRQIILLDAKAFVGFDQRFESDKMKSFGRKNIELVRVGEHWKILKEDFTVKQFLDKEKTLATPTRYDSGVFEEASPKSRFVVHGSTQIDSASAASVVNGLRQLGFNAYSSPLFIGKNKPRKIYRIFVDRLPNWEAARQLAEVLQKTGFAPFAVPVDLPYALQVGKYLDLEEAQQQVGEMYRHGFSSIMMAFKEPLFPSQVYTVLVGAFLNEQNARKMSQKLSRKSIKWILVQP